MDFDLLEEAETAKNTTSGSSTESVGNTYSYVDCLRTRLTGMLTVVGFGLIMRILEARLTWSSQWKRIQYYLRFVESGACAVLTYSSPGMMKTGAGSGRNCDVCKM